MLPEEEEEAPAQKFNVRAQLHEFIKERQDVRDVRERQHEQRFLQLTGKENVHIKNAIIF